MNKKLTIASINDGNVLIDTWWNVNGYHSPSGSRTRKCFNRYMVECESIYRKSIFSVDKVLIDTWWNVNVDRSET